MPKFDGAFVTDEDDPRLEGQLFVIRDWLIANCGDNQWFTVDEIYEALRIPIITTGLSAQLRNLRKEKFGSHTVWCRHRPGVGRGVFEYHLDTSGTAKGPDWENLKDDPMGLDLERDEQTGRLVVYQGEKSSPYCAQCPCAVNGQPSRPVPGYGVRGSLAVIGEGPGSEEVRQGHPFIGPSGKLLNKALKSTGVDRGQTWVGNATLCPRPQSDADLAHAVKCCKARLAAELQFIQPRAILALGKTALVALETQEQGVIDARGTLQKTPLLPDVPVFGSIHPAAILRGGAGNEGAGGSQKNVDAQMMFFLADVAKAWGVTTGAIPAEWDDSIKVITDVAEIRPEMEKMIDECYAWGALGLDLEWTEEKKVTWFGIGTRHRAVSFWWPNVVGEARMRATMALADAELPTIIQNLQADKGTWEKEVGPINGRIEDTMLLHHVAFPGIDHDLQSIVSQFLVVPPWKSWRAAEEAQMKEEKKAAIKAAKEAEREAKKKAREEERDRKRAEKEAERKRKREEKQKAHEARNAARVAEKERKKAEKQRQHEEHNRKAAEKKQRKVLNRDGTPCTDPE